MSKNNNNPVQEEMTAEKISEQQEIRRGKLKDLREAGRDPFLNEKWEITGYSNNIRENFDELEGKSVSCAGRVMRKRVMGKAAFFDIQDKLGTIQCHVKRDEIGTDEYKWFKKYDIGDIAGVKGTVVKTRTGEVTIEVTELVLLSKSLQVLPDKWDGLKDADLRYRQRYVDLIMNPEVKDVFYKRSKITGAIRKTLEDQYGYLEVDTPILTSIAGGANARPFSTHHNTLDIEMKLRISNELFLKRLIVGGLDRVYEMGRMFRNEGMDRSHNPEYTSIECYMAYAEMEDVMDVLEQIVYNASMAVNGTAKITYDGKELDLTPPWKRLDMAEAVKEITGVDFSEIETDEQAQEAAIKKGMDEAEVGSMTRGKIIAEMFDEFCEEEPGYLDGPVFVTGHPVDISPLAKRNSEDPRITRRFEAYINGWEIANAFSELNDPIDQFERFSEQQKQLDTGADDEAHPMDMDFVNALEVGMPPTAGLGIGVDRVVMLLTDAPSIRDVILFPTMKPLDKKGAPKKEKSKEPEKVIDFSKVEIEPLFEDMIDFDTFIKSDFRAVKVKECEAVKKSKKLLKFVLDDGTGENRIILSGIRAYYEPEDLVGKTLLAITNLPPRKMMGIESCGMLISAVHNEEGEEQLNLLMLENHIPAGAKMC